MTGPQQPYGPPPQPPVKQRNWFARHKILTGAGVVALTVIIASAASSGGGGGGSKPAASSDTSSSSAAQQPAAPQTLLQQAGSGDTQTASFTAAGDWDLAYSYDCSKFGTQGNFAVEIMGSDGAMSLSNVGPDVIGEKGQDVSHEHHGGTYYLTVISECDWSVTVTG